MAKLIYPSIIARDKKYHALAELGERLRMRLRGLLVNNIDIQPLDKLDLFAVKRSMTNYDGWMLAESEDVKRELLKNAFELHQSKGTPSSIINIIRFLGFGNARLIEGLSGKKRDGSFSRDGMIYHANREKWAYYRVILDRPVTLEQADLIKKTLKVFAPARCILKSLEFKEVAIRHNGLAIRNGSFTRGTIE